MSWFFLFVAPVLFAGFLLVLVFAFLFPLLGFVIALPFRILGWVLGLLGSLLLLPLVLAVAIFGVGALVLTTLLGGVIFLVPFVPFLLLALGIAWFVRRPNRHAGV